MSVLQDHMHPGEVLKELYLDPLDLSAIGEPDTVKLLFAENAGVVTFHRLDDDHTRLTLQLEIEPEGTVERIGDALGLVQRRAARDMQRFKMFIEDRGTPTGAWRGTVAQTRT